MRTNLGAILVALAAAVGMCFGLGHFVTNSLDVVVRNPTEDQIIALYDYSGDANRVWIDGVEKIFGDNSLVVIKMSIRRSEYPGKIIEALENAGITNGYSYEKLRIRRK